MQQCRRVTLVMFTWMCIWLCTVFLALARCEEEVCSASGHLRQGHASMQCLCSRCWCALYCLAGPIADSALCVTR